MTIKRKTQLNLSGSHHNVDADIAWVGSNLYVTGSSQFTGSAYFQNITGSISGTLTGQPYLVAGTNMAGNVNYIASTGQWAISGSAAGGTPGGVDRTVQFNHNGAFAGDVDLQFYSDSLGSIGANTLAFWTGSVGVLSGALTSSGTVFGDALHYNGNILEINTNVLVTQSIMLFEGGSEKQPGVLLGNNASLSVLAPAVGPTTFRINANGLGTAVDVLFDRDENLSKEGINLRPLWVTMSVLAGVSTLLPAAYGSTDNPSNNSFLKSLIVGSEAYSIAKADFSIIAVGQNTDDYGSWTFSVTLTKDSAATVRVLGSPLEIDTVTSGTNALNVWDVNVNGNGDVYCTGSAAPASIKWYGQITKAMVISGSGQFV